MSHKFKEVTSFLEKKCKMLFFLETNIDTHVGSRLIFFLSVVGNFLLTLSVVSNIFRPLSLVGKPSSHPLNIFVHNNSWHFCMFQMQC